MTNLLGKMACLRAGSKNEGSGSESRDGAGCKPRLAGHVKLPASSVLQFLSCSWLQSPGVFLRVAPPPQVFDNPGSHKGVRGSKELRPVPTAFQASRVGSNRNQLSVRVIYNGNQCRVYCPAFGFSSLCSSSGPVAVTGLEKWFPLLPNWFRLLPARRQHSLQLVVGCCRQRQRRASIGSVRCKRHRWPKPQETSMLPHYHMEAQSLKQQPPCSNSGLHGIMTRRSRLNQ